jgi:hypothetical protein
MAALKGLERILKKNYNKLVDPEAAKEAVQRVIGEHSRLTGEPLNLLKKLTKVAYHVIKAFPDDFDVLDLQKIHGYNIDGINRSKVEQVQREAARGGSITELLVYQSHFYRQAASIQTHLFRRTGNLVWLEKSYVSQINSGNLTYDFNPDYTSYRYFKAGKIAEKIYDFNKESKGLTEDLELLSDAYDAYEQSSVLSVKNNTAHSIKSNIRAGKVAERIANEIKDKNHGEQLGHRLTWLEKAYQRNNMAVKMENTYSWKPEFGICRENAARVAGELYKETGNPLWKQRSFEQYDVLRDRSIGQLQRERFEVAKQNLDFESQV